MDVGGAARIPAGIDGLERRPAAGISKLGAAQKGPAGLVDVVAVALIAKCRIEAAGIAMLDVDACARNRHAGAGFDHTQSK